jgi:hypothetical protein
MWKPTQQENLWFHGGNLHQSRHYSLFLALQLKARCEGIPTPVIPATSCVDSAFRVGRSWTGLEVLRYLLRYRLVRVLDTQPRHHCHGFTTAPSEPRLVRVTERGWASSTCLFFKPKAEFEPATFLTRRLAAANTPHAVPAPKRLLCITTPLPRWQIPVCAVVRWLSILGMEPTAKRRGVDNHRITVEHTSRVGEGTHVTVRVRKPNELARPKSLSEHRQC